MLEYRDFLCEDNCCECCACPPTPPYPCYPCPATPFLSSYIEAVGNAQNVGNGQNIAFDIDEDSLDIAGSDIEIDATGTVFTIKRPGLYHVEWSVNLGQGVNPVLICLLENGELSSALSNANTTGNFSSGALINVSEVPFTISLHNYGGPIELADGGFGGTAASIRILRFADGAN